jgi:hypothetical protein
VFVKLKLKNCYCSIHARPHPQLYLHGQIDCRFSNSKSAPYKNLLSSTYTPGELRLTKKSLRYHLHVGELNRPDASSYRLSLLLPSILPIYSASQPDIPGSSIYRAVSICSIGGPQNFKHDIFRFKLDLRSASLVLQQIKTSFPLRVVDLLNKIFETLQQLGKTLM